jgi:uncharacterized membrane protein
MSAYRNGDPETDPSGTERQAHDDRAVPDADTALEMAEERNAFDRIPREEWRKLL